MITHSFYIIIFKFGINYMLVWNILFKFGIKYSFMELKSNTMNFHIEII